MIRVIFLIILSTISLFSVPNNRAEKNILVLISYHISVPWTESFLKGLEETTKIYPNATYYIESLEGMRLGEELNGELWSDYLAAKYSNIKFDGAIAESIIAGKLLDGYGERFLAPHIPRIYFTSENTTKLPNAFTFERDLGESVRKTVDMALSANKNIKKIYIVKGDSLSSRNLHYLLLQTLKTYPHLAVETIEEDGLSEIALRLSGLEKNSVVIYTLLFGGKNGEKISPKQALLEISKNSNAPIYSFYSSLLGAGATGGYMLDGQLVSKEMVRALFDYFYKGEFNKDYRSANYYIDWEVAKKHNIDTSVFFPLDLIFVNRKIPVWVSYENEVRIVSIFVFILLGLLIVFVLLNIRLKKLISALAIEVDERKKQQMLLVQQTKLAALGGMIENIAHQWRQPLSVVGLLFSRLHVAKERGKLDDEMFEEIISKGEWTIQQMSQTIDDFRNFFEPNKQKKDFTIQDVISSALVFMDTILKIHGIKLELRLCDNQVVLNGHPGELSQVILNLLKNASDAIVENKIENGEIELTCQCLDGQVLVVIADNGGGVPAELLSKIFDPYFTTKNDRRGTGIGLYMSKQIIETSMGGKLLVENSQRGARFTIALAGVFCESKSTGVRCSLDL